jgi:hypothetical protein
MKTPRELLLKKHESARPKLDRITRDVVRQTAPEETAASQPATRWTDWLWPSPAAWGAVAAAWLVVIGLNAASAEPRQKQNIVAKHSPETLQALREQRQLFVELVTPAIRDPEPVRPRRRSESEQPLAMA